MNLVADKFIRDVANDNFDLIACPVRSMFVAVVKGEVLRTLDHHSAVHSSLVTMTDLMASLHLTLSPGRHAWGRETEGLRLA